MSSLVLSGIPGFSETPAASFDAGNTAASADLKAVNENANFAVARNEQFWGYYRNGETVALPVSPIDGYEYARNELVYSWSVYWTGAATGALNGTQTAPGRGATTPGGTLLEMGANVDQATGAVSCGSDYSNGTQHNSGDGILMVITHAQRLR